MNCAAEGWVTIAALVVATLTVVAMSAEAIADMASIRNNIDSIARSLKKLADKEGQR
jgi:hypothetical protein